MLEEKDVPILDEIIDNLLSTNAEVNYEQFSNHEYFSALNDSNRKNKFQRLIDIIDYYSCAKVYPHGYYNALYTNQNTLYFKEKGGFKALYDSQLSEIKKQNGKEIIKQKESKMTNWKYYSFWPLTICTIISTIIAVKETIERQKTQESLIQLEIKLEGKKLEQSKPHILPLTHKNQESSFHANSDKETSTRKKK